MLMSVVKVLMAVIILVQTLLGATSAPVSQATVWQVIAKCVMVS
jgi:hypothetical protein